MTTVYTHAIETSSDGDIWQAVHLADTPEEYDGTAAEYGRETLDQWIADEYRPEDAPADEYGNPLLRVVVYPGDALADAAAELATVYPDDATA